MAEKFIETRIQMKRDTASAWTSATGFRPLEGEYIFYTDLNKVKIGKKDKDGNLSLLSELPFLDARDADTVDSKHASDFVQSVKIGTTEYKSGTTVTLPAYPTKSSLGLSNVTNDAQVKRSEMGIANGIATLGSDGKVPTTQLPASIALGETSATAYRGDRGKIAYDHSQTTHAPSNAQKNSDITKAEIEAKLTGTITSHTHSHAVTPAAGTNNTQIATTAFVKTEVNNLISSGSAEPSANTVSQYYFKYN
jgi:hypothetical protein